MERLILEDIVRTALREDLGTGDVTTESIVPIESAAQAQIVAKQSGVLAGMPVVEEVFRQLSAEVKVVRAIPEGSRFHPGSILCHLEGAARAILTGERVALNFLQRLCGIATLTARFVELAGGSKARIVDTRKTTPGLRVLEKYAVRTAGGHNHRIGLYDAVVIKDNHIVAAGGIVPAVQRARAAIPHTMTVTVECETLDQVEEALHAGADILLLDNMDNATRTEAVRRAKGRALTEASGGITEAAIKEIAATGVDIISIGALTHSAPAIDLSLDLLKAG